MYDEVLKHIASRVRGVIHCGAHIGQEAELYAECGISRVVWIEANPELIPRLEAKVKPLGHQIINCAVGGGLDGTRGTFRLSSNDGGSSSLYDPGTHLRRYPGIKFDREIDVTVRSLKSLIRQHRLYDCNLWYFDIQGAECDALRSANSYLGLADFVYAEVQFEPLYQHTGLVADVDSVLPEFSCIGLSDTGYGWGEAFYRRNRQSASGMLLRMEGVR